VSEQLARRIDALADEHKQAALAATTEADKRYHQAVKWALRRAAAELSNRSALWQRTG
jgi:hypothetical protein